MVVNQMSQGRGSDTQGLIERLHLPKGTSAVAEPIPRHLTLNGYPRWSGIVEQTAHETREDSIDR
jgi:hypothetical protein